jgi:DNA-binding NarL/FixJ family response regulator
MHRFRGGAFSAMMGFAMQNPARRLKTLIVEDSPLMQGILAEAVRIVPGLELAAVVDSAVDAVAGYSGHRPEVVILDLVLRSGSGLDVLREIKRVAPECRVVVFTGYDAEQYRTHCLAAGADYFLSKIRQHQELIQLLGKLGDGRPDAAAP